MLSFTRFLKMRTSLIGQFITITEILHFVVISCKKLRPSVLKKGFYSHENCKENIYWKHDPEVKVCLYYIVELLSTQIPVVLTIVSFFLYL